MIRLEGPDCPVGAPRGGASICPASMLAARAGERPPAGRLAVGAAVPHDEEPALRSLHDVLEALEANPSKDRRHVEMKSAIRQMARCWGALSTTRRPNRLNFGS
jgi:hypothetical protein